VAPKTKAHAFHDYLEAIYELIEEDQRVVQARVAERLGVTRAAVSEQIQRMAASKLVSIHDREIRLTAHGSAVAEDAVRRHRLAERFLTEVLKVPWHKAHEQAVEFQNGINEEIAVHMTRILHGPVTCPHGNPVPGTGATIDKTLQSLNTVEPGDEVVLERLTEDVELDGKAMLYFEQHGLMPGGKIRVVSVSPDGTMSLRVGRAESVLGPELADNLWVRPSKKNPSPPASQH
jgi:DtxR family Mn-dependent transcriptional regulator